LNRDLRRRLAFVLSAVSALSLVSGEAMACSCSPPLDPLGTADDVFVARLVSVQPVTLFGKYLYVAEVEGVLKGWVSSRTLVLSEASTCGSFALGEKLVVFGVRGIPMVMHQTNYCLGTTWNPDPGWLSSAAAVPPIPLVGVITCFWISAFVVAVLLRQLWLRLRLGDSAVR
jgi:hypothetical protein